MSPATFASRSRDDLRSATTTPRALMRRPARATASPIPLAAPVTTQTLSLRCMLRHSSLLVMPGLVPGIHVFSVTSSKAWMAGTKPGHDEKMCSPRPKRLFPALPDAQFRARPRDDLPLAVDQLGLGLGLGGAFVLFYKPGDGGDRSH